MRFMIMHATSSRWEAGEVPSADLIARVGALIGDLQREGVLLGGEGLRPSSQGARLRLSSAGHSITRGPFAPANELTGALSIVRTPTLDAAVEWASRQGEILGAAEIDIRPVTEAWDLGIADRPADLTTRRYMVVDKATPATEAGDAPTAAQRAEFARFIDESTRAGIHLVSETLRPSARGRRYLNSRDGLSMMDGPFAETKELLGGYVLLSAPSLERAHRWAREYVRAVGADQVDLREVE